MPRQLPSRQHDLVHSVDSAEVAAAHTPRGQTQGSCHFWEVTSADLGKTVSAGPGKTSQQVEKRGVLALLNTGVPKAAREIWSLQTRCYRRRSRTWTRTQTPGQSHSLFICLIDWHEHQFWFGEKENSSANEKKHAAYLDVYCYLPE